MFSTKIRTAVIALVAAVSFGIASVAPTVSQARPKREQGRIEVDCHLTLPDGTIVWEPEGSVITVYTGLGDPVKLKCVNGGWVMVRALEGTSPTTGVIATSSPLPAL